MDVENIRRICLTARNHTGKQGDLAVYRCMTLQVIDHQKDIPALHHIILSDGSCHIRCQEQHRRHLIIESCHDDGMFHGSAGHQVLVYFFHIFLGLADGHVDTEDILALLVHDGIQCDLGLAGLFVSDDQLSLSFTDGIAQVDASDTGQKRTFYSTALHDRNRFFLDLDGSCIFKHSILQTFCTKYIDDMSNRGR